MTSLFDWVLVCFVFDNLLTVLQWCGAARGTLTQFLRVDSIIIIVIVTIIGCSSHVAKSEADDAGAGCVCCSNVRPHSLFSCPVGIR